MGFLTYKTIVCTVAFGFVVSFFGFVSFTVLQEQKIKPITKTLISTANIFFTKTLP